MVRWAGPLRRGERTIRTDRPTTTEPADDLVARPVAQPTLSLAVTLVLAAGAGGLWALGAQPRGWWPLLPLGVAVLTVALYGQRLRARLLIGAITGAEAPALQDATGLFESDMCGKDLGPDGSEEDSGGPSRPHGCSAPGTSSTTRPSATTPAAEQACGDLVRGAAEDRGGP